MKSRHSWAVHVWICCVALVCFVVAGAGAAIAGNFEAKGKVLNNDGITPLAGDGLSNPGPDGYVQCLYAGPDGLIDPPLGNGGTTGDDVLLETAEYPGQFYTAIGEGYPFLPAGRFVEDFSHSLNAGAKIYCRAWNGAAPSSSTYYGNSGLYTLVDKDFDGFDFGTWSANIGLVLPVQEIEVTPLVLNYGDVYIGSSSPKTVTVQNLGTANLDVSSIALGAGSSAEFAITSSPGAVSLAPGASAVVEVTYSPADSGSDSGTLVIQSNDADEPSVTVSLSGNGVVVPVPEIEVTPLLLSYGDVFIGSSSPKSVTVKNLGTAALDVTSIALGAGSSTEFAITSSPGPVSLAPGASAVVEVTYSPTDSGSDSGTLVIQSNDADEPSVTVSLSGNGVVVPVPEVEVTPLLLSYGDVFIGSSSLKSITIKNLGTAALDVSSIALGAGSSAEFAITSSPGAVSLSPGAGVVVEVIYSPADSGSDSGTLVIQSNDADEPSVTVSLSGNGVVVPVPEVEVSPLILNYGDVYIGSSSPKTVTVQNLGTANLDLSSIALGAGSSAEFTVTSSPGAVSLPPGAGVVVEVTYSPADSGSDSGTLVIQSNDADEPLVTVSLSGNGVVVPVPEVEVTPLLLSYGDVFIGSSSPKSVTVQNLGTAALDVTSIALGAGSSTEFTITSSPGAVSLAPGASAVVEVTYSPADSGSDSGTLVIQSKDADEPSVTVSLSGNGVVVPVPEIEVTPLLLSYGDVYIGSSSPKSVTVKNLGTAALDVTSIALGAGSSTEFGITSSPGAVSLAPGASAVVEVTYSPADSGSDSGTLVIQSNDADEPSVTVSLSGNGVVVPVAEIEVTPLLLSYGDVFIGSSSPKTVTIQNLGTANLDVSSIALGAGSSAEFAITSSPGAVSLAPGASAVVEVTYSPADSGSDSGTLVIQSNDADEATVTVSLGGKGVLVTAIELSVDIKPGSCPNPLNLKDKGVLPLAILGSAAFDVTQIDPASIRISYADMPGVPVVRWSLEDVATPFEGEVCDCHTLGADGYLDLSLKFSTQAVVETLGLNQFAGQTISLKVTGKLMEKFGGEAIKGKDCVRVK